MATGLQEFTFPNEFRFGFAYFQPGGRSETTTRTIRSRFMNPKSHSELADFIFQHIESVHTLEVLLLFEQSPEKKWTLAQIHDRIRSNLSAVKSSVLNLVNSGLIKRVGSEEFYFSPGTPALQIRTTELRDNYLARRAAVVELIHSKPGRNARESSESINQVDQV